MFRGPVNFDKLLDKTTSHLILEQDLASLIQISDLIRQGDCHLHKSIYRASWRRVAKSINSRPKYALASIKKKLMNSNPYTAKYALLVLESVVKNCGAPIHDEVATKQFMETLRDLLKTSSSEEVKQKTLEIIQAWSHAFRTTPKYKAVPDMMNQLKGEGYQFPALKESDAMFAAESAPEWVDDATCHRCRVGFGTLTRKHHCRNCGNVFCSECTSKKSTLPHFGIEKEVRVCDTCYDQNKARAVSPTTKEETLPAEYMNSSLAQQKQGPKQKSEEELKEQEEMDLALALSQSEAEAKEKERERNKFQATRPALQEVQNNQNITTVTVKAPVKEDEEEDPELARYLNRSYWETKQGAPNDRHKNNSSPDRYRNSPPSAPETPTHQMENGLSDAQHKDFVSHLRSQVEIFVNRMKSNSSRGRSFYNDSSLQSMLLSVTDNHSKLLELISQQEEQRVHLEGLQDKLAQVKDALAALDALRDEHQEKLRREAEEAERMKQMQMTQKLHIMRKKKQEYLLHQRQLAIQRVQEQEREMQMRKEQQKQQYLIGSYGGMGQTHPGYPQGAYLPPGYMPQQGMPPHMMGMGLPPGANLPPQQMMGHPGQPMSLQGIPGMPSQQQPMSLQPQGQQQPMSLPPQGQQLPPHLQGKMQGMPPQMLPGHMGHPSMTPGYPGIPQMQPHMGSPGMPPGQHSMHQPGMMPPNQQPQGHPGMMPQNQQQPGMIPQNQQQPGMIPQNPQQQQGMMSPGQQQQGMMPPGQQQPGMMPQGQQQQQGMIPPGQQQQGMMPPGQQQPGMLPQSQQQPPQGMIPGQQFQQQPDQGTAELIRFD